MSSKRQRTTDAADGCRPRTADVVAAPCDPIGASPGHVPAKTLLASSSAGTATAPPTSCAGVDAAGGGGGAGASARGDDTRQCGHPDDASPCGALASAAAAGAAVTKRTGYICWDDYFMAVAFLSAMRSKDPSTQVGACIVNEDKKIVAIGYNGFPIGCSDDELPWARTAASPLDTKYPYVCHAEMNAILNRNSESLKGCTLYVGLFPCNECAKLIIQSGITRVIYLSDKYHDQPMMVASRRLLSLAKVTFTQHTPSMPTLTVDFGSMQASALSRSPAASK